MSNFDPDHNLYANGEWIPFNASAQRWAGSVPLTTTQGKCLLNAIAAHADGFGWALCGQRRLAEETAMSVRSVRTHLKALEFDGVILRVRRQKNPELRWNDLIVLSAWPGRQELPPTGHPKHERSLSFKVAEALNNPILALKLRHAFPRLAESSASSKDPISIYLDICCEEERAALVAAFDALGPWATEANQRRLARGVGTLMGWIEQGLDIEKDFVPYLKRQVHGDALLDKPVKSLNSWRYFEKPVAKILKAKSDASLPGSKRKPTFDLD